MAEFGSHQLDSYKTQPEGNRPSIFEILAQENLSTGLRDAFRQLFKILAENFPERCGYLLRHFEEMYTVVDFVAQFVHLRAHGATFPEHFYGLKRFPDSRSYAVSSKKVLAWLFFVSVFPYVKLQCEKLFKTVREMESDQRLNQYKDAVKVVALSYKAVYPVLHFVWESTLLAYCVTYSLGKSAYHSPLLHMTHTKLVSSSDDFIEDSWEEKVFSERSRVFGLLWKVLRKSFESAALGISVGAFFLQFLNWWYSREGGTSTLCPMPIPPPPSKWPIDMSSDICPVCRKTRTNDTAISSSGFVFCYPCVFRYVKEHGKCPVTGYRTSLDQLIKIYQDSV